MNRLHLLIALVAVLLQGCAVMSRSDCESADWQELGRRDAHAGMAAAPGFQRREQACEKAGVPSANRAAYFRGHDDGQEAHCTPRRGQVDAENGQPRSAACELPETRQRYADGYREGLRRYCTVAIGFELGRRGASARDICPAEWASALQTGYRLGREQHGLVQRLAQIAQRQAEERQILADSKLSAAARDDAARRLRQHNADEAATRRLLREAEYGAQLILQSAPPRQPSSAP